MKEEELRKIAVCAVCKKPLGNSGVPLFYRMKIQHVGVKMDAVKRQDGLAAMLGSSQLASVMGANEDLAEVMAETEMTVCYDCACHKEACVAEFFHIGQEGS